MQRQQRVSRKRTEAAQPPSGDTRSFRMLLGKWRLLRGEISRRDGSAVKCLLKRRSPEDIVVAMEGLVVIFPDASLVQIVGKAKIGGVNGWHAAYAKGCKTVDDTVGAARRRPLVSQVTEEIRVGGQPVQRIGGDAGHPTPIAALVPHDLRRP